MLKLLCSKTSTETKEEGRRQFLDIGSALLFLRGGKKYGVL